MMRWDLINFFTKKFNYKKYLEIGIATGECYYQVDINEKISVDPALDNYAHSIPTYKMTSDKFFETISNLVTKEKYDIIFIDGLHHSEQVDKDISNSLEHLNDNGTIILHDCNPLVEEHQIVPRQSRAWNGDVWKSIVKYRSLNNGNACVIPTDEGLGIINKNIQCPIQIDLPKELTWQWLTENRETALGLTSFENVKKMLS